MADVIAGFPLPERPDRPIEAELEQLRRQALRIEKARLGPALAAARDALAVLSKLIHDAASAAAVAAEVEWERSDLTDMGAAAIKVPDGLTGEARMAAASQAKRRIHVLRKQAAAHSAAAQNWEVRAAELRAAASKLAAEPAPVAARPSAPRGPMLDAIAEINASMAGGAK
jgi:hypothetical protein